MYDARSVAVRLGKPSTRATREHAVGTAAVGREPFGPTGTSNEERVEEGPPAAKRRGGERVEGVGDPEGSVREARGQLRPSAHG